MRSVIRALVVVLALVVATGAGLSHAQRPAGLSTVTTLTFLTSPATKYYDLGPSNLQAPKDWASSGFDDAGWDPVAPLPPATRGCFAGGNIPKQDYWGNRQDNFHLFRYTFTLPQARNYTHSILLIHAYFNMTRAYINGSRSFGPLLVSGSEQHDVGPLLHQGTNVLAIWMAPHPDRGCSGLAFKISVQAVGVVASPQTTPAATTATPPPTSAAQPLTVTVPAPGAVVSGTMLPVQWQPVPGAASYDLQLWLVKASPGQKVSASSVVNFAATLRGTVAIVDVHRMPRGSYQWRMAATDAQGSLVTAWTPPEALTLQ